MKGNDFYARARAALESLTPYNFSEVMAEVNGVLADAYMAGEQAERDRQQRAASLRQDGGGEPAPRLSWTVI